MARGRTQQHLVTAVDGDRRTRRPDELLVEEPLSILLDGTLVATTMRTPGHDFELAAGYCFTEGLLGGAPIEACRYCAPGAAPDTAFNAVTVDTGGQAPQPTPRLSATTAACGLCGSASLDDVEKRLHPLRFTPPIDIDRVEAVIEAMKSRQALFVSTGASHAAAAFDPTGEIAVVREDIGRHNAVDKVVGRLLLDGALPASGRGLFVSGRSSFEIVIKAWAAGFGTVVAVSAPSSLAAEAATRAGLGLIGFVRGGRFNVYCEPAER